MRTTLKLASQKNPEQARIGLDALLRETIEALSALDAERIEDLAELAGSGASAGKSGPVEWPGSAAEWKRAAASHWILGHLVGATARQLAVQRRIAGYAEGFCDYRPEGDARRVDRLNALLAWPWNREPKPRS
jgi:hypothetical protein